MRAQKVTIGIVGALASALIAASVTAAPALASPSDRLTTLRGTVTAADGHALAGIRVTAGPYEGPTSGPDALRTVRTDRDGHYRVRITAGRALFMKFEDPTDRYFGATKDRFGAKAGSTHRVNRVLDRISTIAGTVRDGAGAALPQSTIRAYDAATGARTAFSARSDRKGHYHLRVEGGRYKLRFDATGAPAEWYGDAATRAASPEVGVAAGATRHGVDAVLG